MSNKVKQKDKSTTVLIIIINLLMLLFVVQMSRALIYPIKNMLYRNGTHSSAQVVRAEAVRIGMRYTVKLDKTGQLVNCWSVADTRIITKQLNRTVVHPKNHPEKGVCKMRARDVVMSMSLLGGLTVFMIGIVISIDYKVLKSNKRFHRN